MKKVFLAALLAVGVTAFAQDQRKQDPNRPQMEKLSPQQRNELMLKKMTLDLGLNENQQKDMAKIIANETAKMEAGMAERKANREKGIKPTADERFARESKKLDNEIALKENVKKILTPDQFKKWEEIRAKRQDKRKEHRSPKGNMPPKRE